MATTTSSSHLIKQFIVFVIIFQHAVCQDSSTDLRSRKIRSIDDPDEVNKINLCLLEIKIGEISDAVMYFNQLKAVSISDILNISYHSEDIDNEILHFKNMVQFVLEQSNKNNDKVAIETLYNLLKPTNDLDSFKAVLLSYLIDNSSEKNDLSVRYIHLMVKKNYLKKIKQRCLKVILNGANDEEFKNFDKDYYTYFAPLLKDIFLSAIRSKSNLFNHFDNILSFIRGYFNYVEDWVEVYSALYKELTELDLLTNKNNIAPKLGRDIRRFMTQESNYKTMDKSNRDNIESMCNLLKYCKSEELYNQIASSAMSVNSLPNYFSSILMVTFIIILRH